ncbi:uncharacterized protein PHALS_10727 [Plasmopara halstedii]|uniref:Uncharacterized protein n=1 Tax=Plasmopara halstedii TaxID=4781 RepID=A0A0P1AIF6_PLAHL|nr:uncharacterized protein PHALS_10727 [Plasmopara halstedii]CEG40533.1 hypothetical protein PHALS_10727 [Plasmopara halstedii]|eukprot:XP_024576902.1 hypothetical protein PHALS_10727 [Plasmopara halstedii]
MARGKPGEKVGIPTTYSLHMFDLSRMPFILMYYTEELFFFPVPLAWRDRKRGTDELISLPVHFTS